MGVFELTFSSPYYRRHAIIGNIRETLLSCPLLETLKVTGGCVTHRTQGERYELSPIELPHLKLCTMDSVDREDQSFLTSLIAYPKHCKLHITPDAHRGHPVLHPVVVGMHQPIRMTTVIVCGRSVIFTESQQDSRCTLEVGIVERAFGVADIRPGWNMELWHGFHLDSVTTLVISSITTLLNLRHGQKYIPHVLRHIMPHIHQLVLRLHRGSSYWQDSWADYVLPELEILVLQNMNVAASSSPGYGIMHIQKVRAFVDQMQSAKAMRLVLRNCQTDQEGLDMLRSILPVDIEYT